MEIQTSVEGRWAKLRCVQINVSGSNESRVLLNGDATKVKESLKAENPLTPTPRENRENKVLSDCQNIDEMLRLLRTLTPGLLALCHLGVAQAAAAQATPPGANAKQTNKAAHSSEEERAAKEKAASNLTPESYDRWKRIESPVLSDDGKWVAYSLVTPTGYSEIVVKSTHEVTEFRVSRGLMPQPNSVEEHRAREQGMRLGRWTRFTADSRLLLFTITSSTVASEMGDQGSNPSTGVTLGIMNLSDGAVMRVPGVSSFILPSSSGRYVAYLLDDAVSTSTRTSTAAAPSSGVTRPSASPRTLVLHYLETGAQLRIPKVLEVTFLGADYLAYSTSTTESNASGVYVRRLSDDHVVPLLTGPGNYRSLTTDISGTQVAFLSNRHEHSRSNLRYSVYYTASPMTAAKAVVASTTLHGGIQISPDAGLRFTRRGNALLFGVAPTARGSLPAEVRATQALFDFWHWRDSKPQSRQKQLAERGPPPSYLSVYHIKAHRWVQLASDTIPAILVSNDARHALGVDQSPYMVEDTWGERIADLYLIDVMSGERSLLRRGFRTGQALPYFPFKLSPSGKYLMFFENRRWFSYNFASGKFTDLTGDLLPAVEFELDQRKYSTSLGRPAMPIGIAGWSEGDRRALIYAQHDIWEIDPSGSIPPRNLTDGVGLRENIVFRVWPHEWNWIRGAYDNAGIDEPFTHDQILLLTAHDDDSMRSGLWRTRMDTNGAIEPLLMLDKKVSLLARARNSEQYLLTQETFNEFPDLWTGTELDKLRRLTDANPQQKEYMWGTAELVEWTSNSGVPLQGVLYKPEGFDPSTKYPMIVDTLNDHTSFRFHRYGAPRPAIAAILQSPATYVSDGYLVFKPDTEAPTGYTLEGTHASVVSGVRSIIDRGFVDPARIGLIGQSMGGYATAYIITRTHLFRCAVESAGLTNSLSGYFSMPSWYERGAAMHGRSLWEDPLIYLANSPVLFADRVETPLLMMHNENDQQIPFSQGLEFYIALRRNRKEAYLFNYNNEGHTLYRRANQLDWDQRMREFLDHFLMDSPKPDWMQGGTPHSTRGREQSSHP